MLFIRQLTSSSYYESYFSSLGRQIALEIYMDYPFNMIYRWTDRLLSQVQSDHFDEFFAPELDKHGYQALYKRKTNEVS